MTKLILGAIALALAVPAYAQAAPAPAPEAEARPDCCEKMTDGKQCCCKDKMDHMKHGEKPASAGHQDHATH